MDFEFTYIFELINHDACKIALENVRKVLKKEVVKIYFYKKIPEK